MMETLEKSIMETYCMTDNLIMIEKTSDKDLKDTMKIVEEAELTLQKADAALMQANELVNKCEALRAWITELDDGIIGLQTSIEDATTSPEEYNVWSDPLMLVGTSVCTAAMCVWGGFTILSI